MTLLAKSAGPDGKPETLRDHSMSVVQTIRQLFERLPANGVFDPDLLKQLETAALAHDIGKAAAGFQSWLRGESANWNGWRHEILSAAFAAGIDASEEVIFAVLTHHKRIPVFPPTDDASRLRFRGTLPEDWEPMRQEFEQNRGIVRELWWELCEHVNRPNLLRGATAPLNGAFINPAWRRTDKQVNAIPPNRRLHASLIRGLLISADHLASGHTILPAAVDLKQFRPKFELRPFQTRASTPGNVILRAPTGSGKTEAALTWAARNQPRNGRLFYTLPYTAALNAMYSRLRNEFPTNQGSIGLLHGRAAHHLFKAMQDDYPNNAAKATAEALGMARLAREMYHTVRVCTPHQLLRYTLRGRGWEQILSEIPGACIVFDEVHSYDPALAGLTLGTARLFHKLGANLMFISATLPRFLDTTIRDLVPCQPIRPDSSHERDRDILSRLRHVIRVEDASLFELLPRIVADALSGLSVLVVCNHVSSAQAMAEALRPRVGRDAVCLFHGRFNMRDRALIEGRLTSVPLPAVLVATQVLEVSLDISYRCGYLEAAPIDALAQRMGRVNRRGERPPAAVTIASKPLSSHSLYDSKRTLATLDFLRSLKGAITEQELAEICDKVYELGYEGDDLATFVSRRDHKFLTRFEESVVAGDHESWTERVIELDNRIDVLPCVLRREFDSLFAQRRWLEADALTVNVYANRKLMDRIDKSHEPWLVDLPYASNGLELPHA